MVLKVLLSAATSCALTFASGGGALAQNQGLDGEPGVSAGSSAGFEGMADTESFYLGEVNKALKKGKTNSGYIASLLGLGMHYNRAGRFLDAARTLRKALAIIDAGALKPTPAANRQPEKIVERQHDGVVSAEVIRVPMPYEEMLQELLPQLISAEISANELKLAEPHIKRLLALKGPNDVADKLAQISAYSSYATLMRKLGRKREADAYQKKADDINATFIPL